MDRHPMAADLDPAYGGEMRDPHEDWDYGRTPRRHYNHGPDDRCDGCWQAGYDQGVDDAPVTGAMLEAIREADEQASIAHDYIWPQDGRTPSQDEASDAIWRIHQLLRPFIGPQPGDYPEEGPVGSAVQGAWNDAADRQRVHIVNGQPCDDPTCYRSHGLVGT